MANRLVLLPDAYNDAQEAYEWYEVRSPGLGDRFLTCVDECINYVMHQPELFAVAYKEYRRAIVRHFPYVIFYQSADDIVTIHAIFHSAQDPKKWRRRLSR